MTEPTEQASGAEPTPSPWRDMPLEWLQGDGPLSDIVVSSRVRLARNLLHHRFPLACSPREAEQVRDVITQVLQEAPFFSGFQVVDLAGLSPNELHMLVERHVESPMHAHMVEQGARGRALFLGPRAVLTGMINEEDHLRLQAVVSGLQPEAAWELLSGMDDALEERLEYAFSERLGYVTACPSNLGTGMRVSVMMHLPGLILAGGFEMLRAQMGSQVGMAMRGLYGEGSGISGSLVQISNQVSLGPAEEDIIAKVRGIAMRIVEQEVEARKKLRQECAPQLGDKVWRSLGILRHARIMEAGEAIALLSLVRLGVELELLPAIPRAQLNNLLVALRSNTLQVWLGEPADPLRVDMMRAQRIRDELREEK